MLWLAPLFILHVPNKVMKKRHLEYDWLGIQNSFRMENIYTTVAFINFFVFSLEEMNKRNDNN